MRPNPSEYAPYFGKYIERVPDGDICQVLAAQHTATLSWLSEVPTERYLHRYAPGKWSVKEVLGHTIDTERIMATRALAFARGDAGPLPGFDENAYVAGSSFDSVEWNKLLDEWTALRAANTALFSTFSDTVGRRSGQASGNTCSARSLAWIIAGHELHHLGVLKERYSV